LLPKASNSQFMTNGLMRGRQQDVVMRLSPQSRHAHS